MSDLSELEYIFQLIDSTNGTRCEPFISSVPNLAKALPALSDEAKDSMMILVIAPIVDGEQGEFSRFPIMKVETFLAWFNSAMSTESTTEEFENV